MTDRVSANQRRIATVGMFDGVHLGHQHVIGQLKAMGEARGLRPTVYTFGAHPMAVIAPERAPKLITTNVEREQLIRQAGAQDVFWLVFDDGLRGLTAKEFMTMLHESHGVDVLIMGYNHRFGSDRLGSFDAYREVGQQVGIDVIRAEQFVRPEFDMPISSSAIRKLIDDGDVATANRMLGHPFTISGSVAHGRNIGAKIGYPTANVMPLNDNQLIPAHGVYAAVADVMGREYPAMVNVGTNPTIDAAEHPLSIEAHLIGFDGDIYGMPIDVRFIERLRDEQRFSSLEALKAQLEADRALTLSKVHK